MSVPVPTTTDPTRFRDLVLFGQPSLLKGENRKEYAGLRQAVSDAIQPTDIMEEIWARDIVDLEWEVLRWRREKANLLKVEAADGFEPIDKISIKLDRLERIEQLIAFAERRRNLAYREIENHRAPFGDRLKRGIIRAAVQISDVSQRPEL